MAEEETPQGDKPKKRNNKVWIITIVAVLVVAVGGVVTYFLVKDSDSSEPAPTEEQEEEQLSPEFQDLYEGRKKEVEDELASAETPEEESEAYIDYANLESSENNNDAALDYAQKAVDAHESVNSLGALAFQAKLDGNYELAAEAYGKAAELIRQAGGENSEYEYQAYIEMKEDAERQNEQ